MVVVGTGGGEGGQGGNKVAQLKVKKKKKQLTFKPNRVYDDLRCPLSCFSMNVSETTG